MDMDKGTREKILNFLQISLAFIHSVPFLTKKSHQNRLRLAQMET